MLGSSVLLNCPMESRIFTILRAEGHFFIEKIENILKYLFSYKR